MGTNEKQAPKATAKKANPGKSRKQKYVVKFDSSGFWLALGVGVVIAAIGVLIVWATKTAPDVETSSSAVSTSHRLVNLMPKSAKEWLATILGYAFVGFGLLMVFMAFKIVVKYIIDKAKE